MATQTFASRMQSHSIPAAAHGSYEKRNTDSENQVILPC